MIYPNCQKEIPDAAKFCPECGSNVSATSQQSGVEDGGGKLSIGGVRTMASGPGQPDAAPPAPSLGAVKTMEGPGAGPSAGSTASGTPLSEQYEIIEEAGRGLIAPAIRALCRSLAGIDQVKQALPAFVRLRRGVRACFSGSCFSHSAARGRPGPRETRLSARRRCC